MAHCHELLEIAPVALSEGVGIAQVEPLHFVGRPPVVQDVELCCVLELPGSQVADLVLVI